MNFLEAIEPHEARLDAYQKLKSYSGADPNELRELINIFMTYVANPKGDMVPSLGCGGCIDKMFQRLVTHREIERQKNVATLNKFLKGVGAIEINEELCIKNLENDWHQIDLEDQIKQEEIDKLKAECREKGIKYHHKAGIKKLKELLNG